MTSYTYNFGGALPPFLESWGALAPLAPPFRRHWLCCKLQPAALSLLEISRFGLFNHVFLDNYLCVQLAGFSKASLI